MKWVYEKYPAQWDSTAFTGEYSGSLFPYTINIGTLEVEERNPSVGEAALHNETTVSNYTSGWTVTVHVYQGPVPKGHQYIRKSYTRDQLSTHRIKGDRLSDIVLEEGIVPDDGIHTDGYWYVKVKPAFPTMRIMRDGQGAEVETGLVLKDGVWKPIEEIYKLQDGQWVQA